MPETPTRRLLFVCLGNICRSPAAEGIFRRKAEEAGLADRLKIDSAGTTGYHHGAPPDARMRKAAKARGYILEGGARPVLHADFNDFDLILAMDSMNLADLRAMRPKDSQAEIYLFTDFAQRLKERDVPDPYHGGAAGFERALDLIEDAAEGLLAHLRGEIEAAG